MSHAQLSELTTPELRALITLIDRHAPSRLFDEEERAIEKLRRVLMIRLLAAERLAQAVK